MADRLISADNHIDMTYCPPDLWSDAAPKKWSGLVPRTDCQMSSSARSLSLSKFRRSSQSVDHFSRTACALNRSEAEEACANIARCWAGSVYKR